MIVGKIPSKRSSIKGLFDDSSWFDDTVMEGSRYRLVDDAADDLGDVTNSKVSNSFRNRSLSLLKEYVQNIEPDIEDEMTFNSDILGCFAVREHNDTGICDFNQRWLLVLQCGSGYVFCGTGPEGEFSIPLEPGMVFAFDESINHQVLINKPGAARNRKANYMFTMPNPNFVKDKLKEINGESYLSAVD